MILTLACGKFRLNDLPLGTVPGTGLPRILDVGQCNDAYSAIRIALALADAFGCTVNDLPLSLVLCWFEQKAVCILIALLALGIRNIRLGPTLPAFLSPGVVQELQRRYDLKAITTPEETCGPFWDTDCRRREFLPLFLLRSRDFPGVFIVSKLFHNFWEFPAQEQVFTPVQESFSGETPARFPAASKIWIFRFQIRLNLLYFRTSDATILAVHKMYYILERGGEKL